MDSQDFDSYVPLYDVVPEKWDDARPFLVETLKKISNAVNLREIGWLLDEELLSGEAFYPSLTSTNQLFRSVLRKVVICSPLSPGANTVAHGINTDVNFTLIKLWVAATNSTTFYSTVFANSDTVNINGGNIVITSDGSYDRANAFISYIQEI